MAFHFSKRKLRPRESEEIGELNIVPYLDIMMNLIMFMLLSMTGLVAFSVINVAAPKYGAAAGGGGGEDPDKPKLLLTVLVSDKGFFVAGSGGVLPGDTGAPTGAEGQPTIGLKNGEFDFDGLTSKMVEIKRAFPAESKIVLGADDKIPYEILVRTMDACRKHAGQELFYDVSLTRI